MFKHDSYRTRCIIKIESHAGLTIINRKVFFDKSSLLNNLNIS